MFKNIINLIFWISLFNGILLCSISLNVIAIAALAQNSKSSLPLENDSVSIVKNKILAFVSLTLSNIFYDSFEIFIGMDNAIVASVLSLVSLLGVIALFYYTFLMIVYSFAEVKELKTT